MKKYENLIDSIGQLNNLANELEDAENQERADKLIEWIKEQLETIQNELEER